MSEEFFSCLEKTGWEQTALRGVSTKVNYGFTVSFRLKLLNSIGKVCCPVELDQQNLLREIS